jgi:hypothetical protein
MRLREYFEKEPEARKAQRVRSKSSSASIATHGLFVPMLTGWGAALLGLIVIVLPASAIARIATLSGLGAMGGAAKFAFAGVAALLGAGLAFVIASAFREKSRRAAEQVSVISAVSSRRVRPINPAAELGSDSLDAPIDKMPFGNEAEIAEDGEFEELFDEAPKESTGTSDPQPTLGELSQRGYDIEEPGDCYAADEEEEQSGFTRSHFKTALIETCEGATCEAASPEAHEQAPEPAPKPAAVLTTKTAPAKQPLGRPGSGGSWSLTQFAPETETLAEKPVALDLGEFAELPGRNAVWVEEEAVQAPIAAAPPSKPRAVPSVSPSSALNKLRQTPTEDLSLVQMVERFAGALHEHQREHQQAERSRLPKNGAGRDAALADALKALTLFTERGFDQPIPTAGNASGETAQESELGQTERELRDALVKLQNLRGAA